MDDLTRGILQVIEGADLAVAEKLDRQQGACGRQSNTADLIESNL